MIFLFLIVVLEKHKVYHLTHLCYIHIVVQQISRIISSCKTESLYPWAAAPYFPSPSSLHSAFCLNEFDYFRYLIINGVISSICLFVTDLFLLE